MFKRIFLVTVLIAVSTTGLSAASISAASIWEKPNKKLGDTPGPAFMVTTGGNLSSSTSNSTLATAYASSDCSGNIALNALLEGTMTFNATASPGTKYNLNTSGLYTAFLTANGDLTGTRPLPSIASVLVRPMSSSGGAGAEVFSNTSACFAITCTGSGGVGTCTTSDAAKTVTLPELDVQVVEPSLMFVNTDYGANQSNSSYVGMLTIHSGMAILYSINVATASNSPTVTKVSGGTCVNDTPSTSCTQAFSTSLPLNLSTTITAIPGELKSTNFS